MAAWLERAAGPGGPALALVYLELVLALTLLPTVLHFRRLRETRDELKAVRLYFLACFALFLALPGLIILTTAGRPLEALASFGWTFGRVGLGAALTLGGLPLAILAGFIGSRDPALRKMYPFAKTACADRRTFAGYELSYVVLYYLPWESVFRGVLFLPLVPAIGLIPALAVQTVISTLLHIGHPDSEIFAAAGAGLAFGLIAFFTGSFVYPLILHASAGVSTDTFLFLRSRKAGR
ncbi:MAG: CPBP family glutamic-type intramembrane protease [Candidatus Aminicenantales bacterium]